jgi:thymidylate kinase
MALVIIEGCDGAGKTLLASRLTAVGEARGYQVTVLHKGPPEREPFAEYTEDLDYTPDPSARRLVVCDRWHLGEVVYGAVYRGGSRLTPRQLDMVETVVDALGAVKVVLDAPDDVLARRAFSRDEGEDLLRREDLSRVAAHYRRLADELPGWRRLDVGADDDTHQLAARLFTRARRVENYVTTDEVA